MQTVTFNLHSFSELSSAAQERAIARYREQGLENDLFDDQYLLQDFRDRLGAHGIDNITFRYTGFSSQGDGLSFIAQVGDIPHFLTSIGYHAETKQDLNRNMDITFWPIDTRYNHERTVDTLIDLYDVALKNGPLYYAIEDWRIKMCQEMYRELESLYGESTCDAAIGLELEARGEVYLFPGVLLADYVGSAY